MLGTVYEERRAMGEPVLEVRLLGNPEVKVTGSPLRVDTRKAIAILAYLAVEGAASRDHLTALLWPEAAPDRARATFRRTLSALRTGIGGDISSPIVIACR